MTPVPPSAFALPDRLAAKADPALVAADDRHLAAVTAALARAADETADRLDARRRSPVRAGQAALERDQDVRRLAARLRLLRAHGADLCLGRMVPADGGDPVYVGRLGLADPSGQRLLVDWRSPAAAPYFAATRAHPLGLAARRRYRWTRGRITDYWDEVLDPGAATGPVAPDDESAFLATLDASRSDRMRDVLGTLQADQDVIVRAPSRGTLVVDGGPGTGKTVVALHRAAYLLYADPRVAARRGGVLVVGPHRPYLDYVADVLPGLGEDGVRTCTLRDLVPEGAGTRPERDPEVARLKSSAALVAAIEPAVRFSERPPAEGLVVGTPWGDVEVGPQDWADAFGAVEPGTPHNEARGQVRDALLDLLAERVDDAPPEQVRHALAPDLAAALGRAWPLLDAAELVADLWSVPAYLRLCAPSLSPDHVRLLQRDDPRAWTDEDLPLLDAARHRLGDPGAPGRADRARARATAARARMDRVVDELVAADDSELAVMHMLRGADLRDALAGTDDDVPDPDGLAGPFAHVVVDEAQELTDAQWAMVLRRCPSRSLTVVGDRAQARRGFPGTWAQRLGAAGLPDVTVASLTVSYRTPAEVMAEAAPVIRAVLPDAGVPTSVRRTGVPVVHGALGELDAVLDGWLAAHEGVACVVGAAPGAVAPRPRVRALAPDQVKGLEFDLVVLVDPDRFGPGVTGAVDRYVAMTRTTRQLVVLTPPAASVAG